MDFLAAKEYVMHYLQTESGKNLFYHNIEHTLDVYQAAQYLAEKESISGRERLLVETAALYHDCGITLNYHQHEQESANMAAKLLANFEYTQGEIQTIRELIFVTRLPQKAASLLEQILCDADLDYLGRADYFIHSFKLKLEWHLYGIHQFTLPEWFLSQKDFLSSHSYFTHTAREERENGKQDNIQAIEALLHFTQ